jgi:flagellar biosynthesis chaperone FliJ
MADFCFYFQFEINKKRDAELAKLRRLLEDVHMESEETAAILRKKHQEAIGDYQDQLEQLAKARQKYEFMFHLYHYR